MISDELLRQDIFETARITLHDVLGRTVRTVPVQTFGRTSRQFTVDRIASGVYLLQLSAGNERRTQKVVVTR